MTRRNPIVTAAIVIAVTASAIGAPSRLSLRASPPDAAPQFVSSQTATGIVKTGTAVVLGRVLRDDTNEPVVASSVCMWLERTSEPQFCELTDEKGRFLYRNVAAGRYHLVAEPGLLSRGSYGGSRIDGAEQLLEIADGARLMDVVVHVFPLAHLAGIVIDEANEPVVGVEVEAFVRIPSLRPVGSWRYTYGNAGTAVTDDRGAFRISAPPDGEYVLSVESAVFASVSVDTPSAEVPTVQRAGRRAAGLVVGPTIQMDDALLRLASGWRPSAAIPPPQPNGEMYVYPTTFYPSVQSVEDATYLRVKPGEQRTGLTIGLRLARGFRVSGRVVSDGAPVAGATVVIRPTYAELISYTDRFETALALTDKAGEFSLRGVPPGRYILRVDQSSARASNQDAASIQTGSGSAISMGVASADDTARDLLTAARMITISDADQPGVDMEVHQGSRATGQVRFEGATQPTIAQIQRLTSSMFRVDTAFESMGYPHVSADGRFATSRYPPGLYTLSIGVPPTGWTLKSMTLDGRDVMGTIAIDHEDLDGVVVTFTDRLTSLIGTATIDAKPDGGAYVVVFPTNYRSTSPPPDSSQFRGVRVTPTGAFSFPDLRPGEYIAAAISEIQSARWQTADILDYLASVGTRVTLADGKVTTQVVHTVTIK